MHEQNEHPDRSKPESSQPEADRHARVFDLFAAARAVEPTARSAWLEANCDDSAMRDELHRLLEARSEQPTATTREDPWVATAEAPSVEVAGFTIGRSIGSGGFGDVYEAMQHFPRRRVAIKVLAQLHGEGRSERDWEREVNALAGLNHPGLAALWMPLTTSDGRLGFAMEFVAGAPIHVHCDAHKLDVPGRVRLMAEACDAVAHAHAGDVVHRDLKPSNVLMTDGSASARPKVIDFGIARLVEPGEPGGAGITGVVGTPGYASPEQIAGDAAAIKPSTDVYSLGVMLAELLSAAMPRAAPGASGNRLDLGPAAAWRSAPRDLVSIVKWATERDHRRRYPSARELGDDLRRYLSGHPVLAAPRSRRVAAMKFVRRHRWGVAAVVALAIVIAVGFGATWRAWRETAHTLGVVDAERRDRSRQAYLYGIQLAKADLDRGDAVNAQRRLAELPEAHRGWEWRHLRRESDSRLVVLRGHAAPVRAVAVEGAVVVSGDWLGTIVEHDVATGEVRRTLRSSAGVTRLRLDARSGSIVAGCDDGKIRIWPPGQATPTTIDAFRTGVNGLDVANGLVVAASQDVRARVFEVSSGAQRTEVDAGGHLNLRGLRFLPDGAVLWPMLSVEIREPDLATVRCSSPIDGQAWSSAVDAFGRRVAIGTTRGVVHLLSFDGLRESARHSVAGGVRVTALAFPPHGGPPIAGLESGTVEVLGDASTPDRRLHGGGGPVTALECSQDGRWLVAGFEDSTVGVWSMDTLIRARPIEPRTAGGGVAFSPDGARIVSPHGLRGAMIWDPVAGTPLARLIGHHAAVGALACDERGELILTASADRTIRLWNATTGAPWRTFEGRSAIVGAAFRPGRRSVASIAKDGEVALVDLEGARQWTAQGPAGATGSMAFDDAGERLYTAHQAAVLEWNLAATAPTRTWTLGDAVCAMRCDGRRQTLAVATVSGLVAAIDLADPRGASVAIHDIEQGGLRVDAALPRRSKRSWGLDLSPDRARMVTSRTGAVRLWEWPTMVPLLTLHAGEPAASESGAAFSPDGERIVLTRNGDVLDAVPEPVRVEERRMHERARREIDRGAAVGESTTMGLMSHVDRDTTSPMSVAARRIELGNATLRAAERGRRDGLEHWAASIDAPLVSLPAVPQPALGEGVIGGAPTGRDIAVATAPGRFDVIDLTGGRPPRSFGEPGWTSIADLAFDAGGEHVAAASGPDVVIYHVRTGERVSALRVDGGGVVRVAMLPDGTLATGCRDGVVKVWRGASTVARLAAHPDPIADLATSADGAVIATCSTRGAARVWLRNRDSDAIELKPATGVRSVALSDAGDRLVLGMGSGAIELWRLDGTPRLIASVEEETSSANATIGVVFSPDGALVAATHVDGVITLWAAATAPPVAVLDAGAGLRPAVAFTGDGAFVCSVTDEGEFRLWDATALGEPAGTWATTLDDRRRAVELDRAGGGDAHAAIPPEPGAARATMQLHVRRQLLRGPS